MRDLTLLLFSPTKLNALADSGLVVDSQGAWTIRQQIPEPTTLALMGIGLAGIGYRRYRTV